MMCMVYGGGTMCGAYNNEQVQYGVSVQLFRVIRYTESDRNSAH